MHSYGIASHIPASELDVDSDAVQQERETLETIAWMCIGHSIGGSSGEAIHDKEAAGEASEAVQRKQS